MGALGLAGCLIALLAVACDEGDPCPPVGIPPIRVTVTDAASKAEICDADVMITSRDGTQHLTDCPYAGGFGAQPFTVTVEKAGYTTVTIDNVTVPPTEEHDCPSQRKLAVALEAAE